MIFTKEVYGVSTLYFLTSDDVEIRITDSVGLDSGNAVLLTGDQTVAGDKTFSDTVGFSDIVTFSDTVTFDSTVAFNEDTTFDSSKTHGLDAYVAPTDDAQFVPKKYVDDLTTSDTGVLLFIQEFTSSDTFTAPTGITRVFITAVGGGGGGGTPGGSGSGGGGGSASFVIKQPVTVTPGTGYLVSLGAAGAAATNGGDTTFGSLITVKGGKKGSATDVGGLGGGVPTVSTAGLGYQGITGGTANSGVSGGGGAGSPFGSGGDGGTNANGSAASGYGAGGGGGDSLNKVGGVGTAGLLIVEWYK